MTKLDDDFYKRKKEMLRKHKEVSSHMVDMVNDMAAKDAIELVRAVFDFLRHTEPLGGPTHRLQTKYAKDVINLIWSYQNRYLSTFLIVSAHEIRDLEKAADRMQSQDYFILQELGKKSVQFIHDLLRKQEEEEEKQKNSKESIGPPSEEGAGDKV